MLSTCSNGRLRMLRERRLKYDWQLRASFTIKGGRRGATRSYVSRRAGGCASQPFRRSATDVIIPNREVDPKTFFLPKPSTPDSLASKVREVLVHSFGAAKSETL